MTSTAKIAQIYLGAQAEFDIILRKGGKSRGLATISFLACDICLAFCEEVTPHACEAVEAIAPVFHALAKEAENMNGDEAIILRRAHLTCETATHDLAHLFQSETTRRSQG